MVDQYVTAFVNTDIAALKKMLTHDAVLEMPPVPLWYVGREHYARFIVRVWNMRGTDWRMLPISANGRPAVAAYQRNGDTYRLHTVHVFAIKGSRVSRTTVFQDPAVFEIFALAPFVGD